MTLPTIRRVAVVRFLVSSMSRIGLGLTLRQVIAPLKNATRVLLQHGFKAPSLSSGVP